MKILWLSHLVPYPPTTGALQRSYNLIRQVAARHEVHLVALNQRALLGRPEELDAAVTKLQAWCAQVKAFPIPADRTPVRKALTVAGAFFSSSPYHERWLRNGRVDAHVAKLAETLSFDVVHVDTINLMQYARLVSGVPLVLNHHNVESHMMGRRAFDERSLAKRIYLRRDAAKRRVIERRWCDRVTMNLVVSELDRDRLRECVGDVPAIVIPNGVDVHYFRPSPPPTHANGGLIFVGPMDLYPNRNAVQYFMKEIWPALLADRPDRQVTFVGRHPPARVRSAVADLRVQAPGFVDDVRPYVAAASIYVCPIRDGGGTRLKVLDALAMGKPLIATQFAVEGLGLVDGEHYVRAETPEQYVTGIRQLEADADLRHRLVAAGRSLVKRRFAWEIIGETLNDMYERVRNGSS